jgi:hypothetical protein
MEGPCGTSEGIHSILAFLTSYPIWADSFVPKDKLFEELPGIVGKEAAE